MSSYTGNWMATWLMPTRDGMSPLHRGQQIQSRNRKALRILF